MNDDERRYDSYLTSLADWERDARRYLRREDDAGECDHCKQRVADGTCYRGEWWCDRCIDADEEEALA